MTLNILLTHQSSAEVETMLTGWEQCASRDSLLIAYGGPISQFNQINHPHKTFIDSPRLKTKDHQREKQSYTAIFPAASEWMRGRPFEYVHLAEFDHVPLVPDINARQIGFIQAENADLLGFRLRRIDGTNYPNYLYHNADSRFSAHWQAISCREDRQVVLRMTGTGSFWRREAFDSVAALPEPFDMYMEIYLPTLAHHLGFRVRDWAAQNPFVHHLGDFTEQIEEARQRGAWSLHPVKRLWTKSACR